ncbi:FAD dependent oxidoreductase [Coniochaeta ligniaria NRRL 30616]|uniref:FAD dependent oxidoreductase n=1 Tax=Coniochaeta ligniaria NRRL 30616 TaxID=1408157 RepID=A0A1J7JF14_9PEZI|nr:FAD dependent oxidoreductase [Coniochaeta ligniaria NRRL 30616]
MTDINTSILIVGGGTFGLSTAYRLAKAGYKHITVLEKSASIPPRDSAGNDLNKIIRAEYEDPFYTDLALQAMHEWQTHPLFAPHFHQTGYLLANSPAAPEKAKLTLQKSLASISSHPSFAGQIQPIQSRADIRAVAPVFDGPMRWTGYLNRMAGYAHAASALRALYAACAALDVVTLRLGEGAASLLFDGDGDDTCVGVRTTSGSELRADRVVLTLGASVASLLPQMAGQITARAWSVGHVQLAPDEATRLRGIPVTYARDLGFFFEPDAETGLLKVCPAAAGYTNFVSAEGGLSLPPEDSDWIPPEDEERIRALLRDTLPALAGRDIVDKKLCWCADAADTEYVIDVVPGKRNLIVASGDSGHAFKMLPVVGDWVRDVLEKGVQDVVRWRWKEQSGKGEASWRVGMTMDLGDLRRE